MAGRVVVPLRAGSDGDHTHQPVGAAYSQIDPPTLYLEKLALQWMKDRGEARPGVTYVLEQLPAGYTLFQKPRTKNPNVVDKWLYGHPEHKPFDSPNRFYPHFLHLMENDGSRIGCPCTVCNTRGGILPRTDIGLGTPSVTKRNSAASSKSTSSGTSSRHPTPQLGPDSVVPQPKGRPKMVLTGMDGSRVDEEGTPDVYRNLIDKLKRHGTLDEAIMEPMSMDWRAEQAILPDLLKKLKKEAQWVPRIGDIILYLRDVPYGMELLQHEATGEYRFYDPDTEDFVDSPIWEAGLVGQMPAEEVTLDDAINDSEQELNVSLSGIRVEPLPNPNETNKSWSKRYKYVPVYHTRPFFLWKEYLEHVPEQHWHPTIKNAFTAMSTMALLGKHRFRGQWPEAQIYCHGIYIGAEIITVGDTVRLLPKAGEPTCTNIIVIKSIRLKLLNLDKASVNDYDEGRPYNSEVWIFGAAYTTEPSRSNKEWLDAENTEIPKSADSYGNWYPLHPSNKELAVPFSRLLGRLYEHDALRLWLPESPDLDEGRDAVLEARAFARANDKRIASSFGATWFWGDTRSEALDLQTVNGLEVGRFDNERDPSGWRKKIKIMEGVSQGQSRTSAKATVGENRSLRHFMAPATTLPMRAPIKKEDDNSSDLATSSSGSGGARKRNYIIDLSEGEDDNDEEIRQQTRIIEEPATPSQKRAKVSVVVD